MNQTLAIARAVLADAVRRKVIWVVLVFAALLAFAIPMLPNYGGEVVSAVYREITLALMFTAALIVGLALAATRIPGEVERRTVFSLLARDVRRWHYIVGSWLGMFLVTGIVIAAFVVIAIACGMLVYHQPMLVLIEGAIAIWLETGVIMALTVLASSRFNPVTAVIAALAFIFIGHSISGVLGFGGEGQPATPWWLPSLDAFNVINPIAHGGGVSPVYIGSMVLTFVALAGLLLVGASAAFSGRDL
ncbi:MAG TPA: ABC transporter permease subunit [Coriobacteriia bacterium]|nr:ABC transporter permease subunit [Coriobacteriia bacterium]